MSFLYLIFSLNAQAYITLDTNFDYSRDNFSQGISATFFREEKKERQPWEEESDDEEADQDKEPDWHGKKIKIAEDLDFNFRFESITVGITDSKAKSTNSDGGDTTLGSQDYSFRAGWRIGKNWNFSLGLNSSQTNAVKYSARGGSLSLGHRFIFLKRNSFSTNLRFASTNIQQNISFGQGINKVEVTYPIGQKNYGIDLSCQINEKISARWSADKYVFNEPKEAFENTVGSRVINNNAGDLVTTVYGLQEKSTAIGLGYYLSDNLELDLGAGVSTTFVDGTTSNYKSVSAYYYFDSPLSMSFGITQSNSTGENATSTLSTALGLSYLF